MATYHLLFESEYAINDNIKIVIPTVEQVLEREDEYYSMITMLTATPYDLMVQLDDMGIDFTKINDYDLFVILFHSLSQMDTSLVFGDLDLKKFVPMVNPQNNLIVLRDNETGIVIDRAIHNKIASVLRKIHHMKRNNKRPGNLEAQKYLLERARIKAKRRKNKLEESQLEGLIVALVCETNFPYDYESVKRMTIYQFNQSLHQVIKNKDVGFRMIGVYAGTVSSKDLKPDDLNWLTSSENK